MSAFMSLFASPCFLPRVMFADAASCALTGALQLAFTGPLSTLTGLDAPLLAGTGAFMLVYAAIAAWMGSRPVPPRRLIAWVAAGNLGWAAGCVVLLTSAKGGIPPAGVAWVLAQAAVVVVLAELQIAGLRGTRPARARALAG